MSSVTIPLPDAGIILSILGWVVLGIHTWMHYHHIQHSKKFHDFFKWFEGIQASHNKKEWEEEEKILNSELKENCRL